jgi:hypothetical protein
LKLADKVKFVTSTLEKLYPKPEIPLNLQEPITDAKQL